MALKKNWILALKRNKVVCKLYKHSKQVLSTLLQLLVARLKEAFHNAKLKQDDDLRNTLILTTGAIGR